MVSRMLDYKACDSGALANVCISSERDMLGMYQASAGCEPHIGKQQTAGNV